MRLTRLARAAATLALLAATALPSLATIHASAGGFVNNVPTYQHIFVIMMENHSYGEIIGNPNAPRINRLAQTYGLATNYYAVTHPSEPNYVAFIGGSYFGIQDDLSYKLVTHTINAPSLASELEAHGLTWKSYQESLPYAGYPGNLYPSKANALYASKHNPFLNFAQVQHSRAEMLKIVPTTQLAADLRSGQVPNFGFIAPNQCADMHGGPPACPFSNKPGDAMDNVLIRDGDAYVSGLVSKIMSAPFWFSGNNAIVVVWDENDYSTKGVTGCCGANPGGGPVAAIVITSFGPRGVRDNALHNHYSLLLTIQDAFRLGCLQHSCDMATGGPMTRLFGGM